MAAFNFRRRQTRRWWSAGATLVVATFFAVFFVFGASANLSGSSFEGNDANLTVDTAGHTDWINVAGRHTGIDLPTGSGDNSFGQGTKEDNSAVTVVSGSIPPNKSNLTRFYEASELVNNQVFLYLAWERTNNLGNANMDFEINKSNNGCPGTATGPCTITRTNGDVLVTYDFPGSGAPTLGILRWLAVGAQNPDQTNHPGANTASECFSSNTLPCWGNQEILNGSNSEGAVNTAGNITDPISGQSVIQNGFGEAAINLTSADVITSQNGCDFGSATTFLKSRSSSSFTSEIKDFVAPASTPVISNCGALKITKTSIKSTTSRLSGATFHVTGPGGYDHSFTTGSTGVICLDSLANGSYTVTETGAPPGYSLDDGSDHTVSVSGGNCPSPPAVDQLTFSDTPLTDITAHVASEASGGTQSNISCVDSGGTPVGNSPQPASGNGDPETVTANGLEPGTYTCTITIDP